MGPVMLHFFTKQGMRTRQNGIFTPQETTVEEKLFANYELKFTLKIYFAMFKD